MCISNLYMKKIQYKLIIQRLFVLLVVGFVVPNLSARHLKGQRGDDVLYLETQSIEGTEYVKAIDVITQFEGNWEYDSLSGTLILRHPIQGRIGIKVGDQRFVIGTNVYRHTTAPPLRREGRMFIPLYFVATHVFPGVSFQEVDSTGIISQDQPTPSSSPTPASTPRAYIFRYPTPDSSTPTPVPTRQNTPRYSSQSTPLVPLNEIPEPNWWENTPTPGGMLTKAKPVIVLDPGNDKTMPGAGSLSQIREWELTLLICEKMAEELIEVFNCDVVFTRKRGQEVTLRNDSRVAIANKQQGWVFVSIHSGALFTEEFSRAAVYYMNPRLDRFSPQQFKTPLPEEIQEMLWYTAYQKHVPLSLELAKGIQAEMRSYYNLHGIITMDSNPRPARLSILRGLTMPGVVVELGNLEHPTTASYLTSERIQEEIAHHIAQAVSDFVRQYSHLFSG